MKKADKKKVIRVSDCLVETLTILSHKGVIDVDTALNYINTGNLQGLQGYLTAIRIAEGKNNGY